MLRVGIVAEGPSDWIVFEEVMKTVHPDVEFEHLQPDQTLLSGFPNGWRGVKAWCEENGSRLEVLMQGVVGRPLHLLVIHADCSMANKAGAERPCPPAHDTAAALGDVIHNSWLGRNPRPGFVILAIPAQSSDAWVLATLEPPYANLADLECDKAAEDDFARRRLLRRRPDGQIKKNAGRYAPLAAQIGPHIESVCQHCPQAEVFRSDFRSAVGRALS